MGGLTLRYVRMEHIRLRKLGLKKTNYFSNCEETFKEFVPGGDTTHTEETDVCLQQDFLNDAAVQEDIWGSH